MRHCFVGDFNIDIQLPNKSLVREYLSILPSNTLELVIPVTTREEIAGKLAVPFLDHIQVPGSDATQKTAVIMQRLADNYFCHVSVHLANLIYI